MGEWLKMNGEAIYGTKPWTYQNDSYAKNPEVWYTSKNEIVYAIMLGWPNEELLKLGDAHAGSTTEIQLIGLNQNLDFVQEETNLVINLPSFLKVFKVCPSCQWASVLKLKNVNAAFNSSYLDYLDEDKIKIEVNKT